MNLKTFINKLTSIGFNLLDRLEFLVIGIVVLFSAIVFHDYFFSAVVLLFASVYYDLSLSSFPEFMLYILLGIFVIISTVFLIYSPFILNKIKIKTAEEKEITENFSLIYISREPWLTTLVCICELIFLIIFMQSISLAHVILITFINIAIVSAILFAPITRPTGIKKYFHLSYGFFLPMWICIIYFISAI